MANMRIASSLAAVMAATCIACSDGATVIADPSPAPGSDNDVGGNAGAGPSTPEGTPTDTPPTGTMPDGTTPDGTPPDGTGQPAAEPSQTPEGTAPGAAGAGSEMPSETDVDGPVTPQVPFVTPRGPCPLDTRVGAFAIEKQAEFGVVQGAVAEGVVPTAIPLLALEDGACSLLERRTLSCIPACVGAQTCGEDGSCIPYPRQVSVGDVTITGLTRDANMSPLTGNSYFLPGADNPPYAAGSQIVLSAAGAGEHAPFQLFGIGTEPLSRAPTWNLVAGTDLSVTWPAPTTDVQSTVLIEITIDQHGASPLTLACEFPDTGSAVVPAALVDRMIDSGVSGFPNGRIMRRTADHVELDVGCVELSVGSPLAASVAVPGFTPCTSALDCPVGQQCNLLIQICE